LGINSVSTEAVNGYELGLRIRLASYQVRFGVIGSDPLRYVGALSVGHAMMASPLSHAGSKVPKATTPVR
jgi:hypothetical protein